jgi:hypothetical protein
MSASTADARHALFKDEITQLTSGLPNRYLKAIQNIPLANALTIADYIQSMKIEINLSDHYKRDLISLLCKLSKYTFHRLYKDLKREDISAFLNSFVKPEESDPLHKWIGTYNIYREKVDH